MRTTVILFTLSAFIVLSGLASPNSEGEPQEADTESFTKNKFIPGEMREVIVAALACYPDLAETKIHFVYKEDIRKSVMQAQPKVGSIFRGKKNRAYVVKISRYLELTHENLDISALPFEVLVGWIAHELGHIMDYKDRSGLSMIGFGAKYWLSKSYLKKAERRADMYALEHGLGDKVIKTKNYVLNHDEIPVWYKRRIKKLYMSPKEFSELLSETAE
ncbi:MAG: hypothetical protein ACFB15_10270 [Cyclobacteriaceae bacterium]